MNLLIYSIAVALICGVIAGLASAHAFRSKLAAYFAAALGAAIFAVLANIGIFYAGAALHPDAPFDGIASVQAAGRSLWVAILFGLATTALIHKGRSTTG